MATWLKAKEAAEQLAGHIREQVRKLEQTGCRPKVAVLLVEGDPASEAYARSKSKWAEKLTIGFELTKLPAEASEEELRQRIERLNADPDVHGIMVELPLPKRMDTRAVIDTIAPFKDVDGMTSANKLAVLTGAPGLYPATPQSCIRLLHHYGYSLAGKHAVVVGRGETVGQPLVPLLLREQATVTVCHSRTPDLSVHLRAADFAFVAAGRQNLIGPDMVHPGLVVVDAGINETADGGIAGGVDPAVYEAAAALSPTPGGVGTLTTVLLLNNVIEAVALQSGRKEDSR